MKTKKFFFLIPILCTALCSLLVFTTLDYKITDLFLRSLPSTPENPKVFMVNIDDYAIENIGTFPFTRNIYADAVNVMNECGVESAIFDLMFLEYQGRSVDENDQIFDPDEILTDALSNSNNITLASMFNDDYELDDETFEEKGKIKNISSDNDTKTIDFYGAEAPIQDFLENCDSTGFVNAFIDKDGYVRRLPLAVKFNNDYYAHLVFNPLLKKLGNPSVTIDNSKILLHKASLSDSIEKDITIPRDNKGFVILKYPKKLYEEYNCMSFWDIYRIAYIRKCLEDESDDADFLQELETSLSDLKEKLNGAICIIGTDATSTTDWGINLYEDHYPNPGIHYTIINQVLSDDFIDDAPLYISIIIAGLFSLLLYFISAKQKHMHLQIITGFAFLIFIVLASFAIFYFTKIYIGLIIPFTSILATFIACIIIGFASASKDKRFITNAFSQCLSKEVVNQIVNNPESFKLGGQKLNMSAIFTDIQKFSTFSELLSAGQLVALLNYYLTIMSDIIIDEHGTIDKYEGDAIIALVGAPLPMEDHALRAVRAALKIKLHEKVIDKKIKKIAGKAKPESMDPELYEAIQIITRNKIEIFTRIGINSGEMIAGYMGSEKKKNYTMMGNNVNLAARLEGLNKHYSTFGIIISESTKKLCENEILCRKLDNVQVVNVKKPVQLYEPLVEKSKASEKITKYVSLWDEAIEHLYNGEYESSYEKFKKLSSASPLDNTAKYYLNLLENFFLKGKVPSESDNIGVAYNSELKCFKILNK